MHEQLMEAAVERTNALAALRAVERNGGAAGIDRMTTRQLRPHLQKHWEKIRSKLLAGTYTPSPVRKVEIPKPGGGIRMLGIPTVMDRFIGQMLLQAMNPIFDPGFRASSYGFRPGRSAHQAVCAAQEHIASGKNWVVDIDISKFFDRVNHDVLMHRLGRRIRDKRVLRLVGRMLKAGMMCEGVKVTREQGTPQGAPHDLPAGGMDPPTDTSLLLATLAWAQRARTRPAPSWAARSHAQDRPERSGCVADRRHRQRADGLVQRRAANVRLRHALRACRTVSGRFQPPDAENGTSGGVGGVRGAIPAPRPDQTSGCAGQRGGASLHGFQRQEPLRATHPLRPGHAAQVRARRAGPSLDAVVQRLGAGGVPQPRVLRSGGGVPRGCQLSVRAGQRRLRGFGAAVVRRAQPSGGLREPFGGPAAQGPPGALLQDGEPLAPARGQLRVGGDGAGGRTGARVARALRVGGGLRRPARSGGDEEAHRRSRSDRRSPHRLRQDSAGCRRARAPQARDGSLGGRPGARALDELATQDQCPGAGGAPLAPGSSPRARAPGVGTRQQTLARKKALRAPPDPKTVLLCSELCAVNELRWGELPVPFQVVLLRERYADGHAEQWALLSTEQGADPQAPPRDYARRVAIEERHRHLKCFYDLTDFHSRSLNAVVAQVVFVLLSYSLRQWQLWKAAVRGWPTCIRSASTDRSTSTTSTWSFTTTTPTCRSPC